MSEWTTVERVVTYSVASCDQHLSLLLSPFLSLSLLWLRNLVVERLVVRGDLAHLAFLLGGCGR